MENDHKRPSGVANIEAPAQRHDPTAPRKPYVKPKLRYLGSLKSLTLASKSGIGDGPSGGVSLPARGKHKA
jgi:hypothetical protein